MPKDYYNDAFIGNKNITASLSKYGELLRLYYPLPDYRQYSEFFHVGVTVNNSNIIYLHKDVNNIYDQYYTEDTNILNTIIENTYFNFAIKQTDAVMINKDILLKKYEIKNNNKINLDVKFFIDSKMISSFNNMAGSMIAYDSLIQYSHNFLCAFVSKEKLMSHQLNNIENNITTGNLADKDYIAMSSEAAIGYDLGTIKPGEKKEISFACFMKYDSASINEAKSKIPELRKLDVDKEFSKIESYWKKFLADHDTIKIKRDGTEFTDKLIKIYKRTILYMPFLINEDTGAISASLEVDEDRDKSGRYSYTWPRDSILIYDGIQYLGFEDMYRKYFEVFLKNTQAKEGFWEQRFYTDGRLAPCWGYQIDETAIVVWGAYQYFKLSSRKKGRNDLKFIRDNLKMLEKACTFLEKYVKYILNYEEKEDKVRAELEKDYNYKDRDEIYKHPSYDLWENTEGIHLYSLSAIYSAFTCMIEMYNLIKDSYKDNRLKQESINTAKNKYEKLTRGLKEYILTNMVDKDKNILYRNTNDKNMDISILGATIPFKLFSPNEKLVRNTVEQINMTLRTFLGGYLRYQNDNYLDGLNPWIIATAWMGMYYKQIGNEVEANKCLKFIVNSATPLGFLPEQANSELNQRWVIGLGWSHAMFIKLIYELYKNKK